MPKRKSYSSNEVCKMFQISKSVLFKLERLGLITRVHRDWRNRRRYNRNDIEEIRRNIECQKIQEIIIRDKRVLVVDDDQSILQVMGDLLTKAGREVCTTTTGEEAVNLQAEKHPGLTFLDGKLERESGLADKIRSVDPQANIIILKS